MKKAVHIYLLSFLSAGVMAAGTSHTDKLVEAVHSPDERGCSFFKLNGVTVADPTTNSSSAWFAVPINHNGHNSITSILLSAFMADKKVTVVTTGNLACTVPEVRHVVLPRAL